MSLRILFLCLAALCSTGIAQESSSGKDQLSLSYIPSDAVAVVGVRPASLMAKPALESIWKLLKEQPTLSIVKDPASISTVQFVLLPPAGSPRTDSLALKITAKSPQPIKKILQQLEFSGAPKQSYGGVDYRQTANKWFVSLPQETTLLIGFNEDAIRSCLLAGEQGAAICSWASAWGAASNGDVCFVMTPALITNFFRGGEGRQVQQIPETMYVRQGTINRVAGQFDSFVQAWDVCSWIVGTASLDEAKIQLVERINSDTHAESMIKENYSAIQQVRSRIVSFKQNLISQDKPESESLAKLLSRVDEALEQTTVARNKEMVHVTTKVDRHLVDYLSTYMNTPVGAGAVRAGKVPRKDETRLNEKLAEFCSVILKDTEIVWSKLYPQISGGNKYQPAVMVFYDRRANGPGCGFATSVAGAFYCGADGKVYIDLQFFEDLQDKFGASGEFAIAYVIAHAVGHHVQNQLGLLVRAQKNQDKMGLMRQKLQADFLAGVWARRAQMNRMALKEDDIENGLKAVSAVADDLKNVGNQPVPESFTYGTLAQRMYWFMLGLNTGDVQRMEDLFTLPDEELLALP